MLPSVTATTEALLDQDSLSPIISFLMGRRLLCAQDTGVFCIAHHCLTRESPSSHSPPASHLPRYALPSAPERIWVGGLGEAAIPPSDRDVSVDFEKCFWESQQRLDLTVALVLFLLIVWEPLQPPPSTCSPITALLSKSHQVQSPRNPDTGTGDGTGPAVRLTVRPITCQGGNTGGGQTCGLWSQTVLFPNLPQQDVTAMRPGTLSIECTTKSPMPGIEPGTQRAVNIL